MNRRNFINLSLLSSAASFLPLSTFNLLQQEIPTEELLGKGSPQLYGNGYQLRKEAYEAFLKMQKAAAKDDIFIQIVSSYRSFDHQKRIWNRKFKRFTQQGLSSTAAINKIIEYSTIPGTSRHHWGTDIDIIDSKPKAPTSLLQPENYYGNGVYLPLSEWMKKNAKDYGFEIVYTNDKNRKGFKHEPWHFSYAPLSKIYLCEYRKLELKKLLENSSEILGHEKFSDSFIQKYIYENVLAINSRLLT
ncbi:M15 family metallopeptidase [Mesonia aestuariivivens]|uniref:M15 family metallopeptidase n=1 Tax=Mesonia aestuariivivens TaxID=2796128 RepID=A0ABS6W1D7_9FLAO|nr:M15 family metallopeptidase [Mesonia aestuariivivens]MBW2960929.1 M15 family metallopeptidase [Mesonia aestuariivivens]